MESIKAKLTAIGDSIRNKTGKYSKLSLDEMPAEIDGIRSDLIEDFPTTPGQWACLARASQMLDVNYVVKGNIPTYNNDANPAFDGTLVESGEELKSLWYSSVRGTEWGFIGYAVSMYSLMTCLNNPKSFVYTKKYFDYFNDGGIYNGNVYGTNCSEFVSYCHDLPYLAVCNTLPLLSNAVDETGTHNSNGMCWDSENGTVDTDKLRTELKLCDFLDSAFNFGGTAGHSVLVTGIHRDKDGVIQEVIITHSTTPLVIREKYSWEEFVSKFITAAKYRPYRFSTLDNVTFPESLVDIVYSDIVTNRGDKVSIRPDMDIALNVLGDGYAGIVLFKDGIQVSTQANTGDWELTNLTTGKYTAILYKTGETVTIDDANEHNSTSFIVCNVSISRSGNEFTYTADAVEGVHPKPMQIAVKDNVGYTLDTLILDIDDFGGSGTAAFSMNDTALSDGAIIHMPFKTEYGFVIAEGVY